MDAAIVWMESIIPVTRSRPMPCDEGSAREVRPRHRKRRAFRNGRRPRIPRSLVEAHRFVHGRLEHRSLERAREALNTYMAAFRTSMDPTFAARLEDRIRAEESFAHGVVLRAEGRTDAAASRLTSAFEIWADIGFEWRAARAAVELAELDAGEIFRIAVKRELATRPDSVFATRARLVA